MDKKPLQVFAPDSPFNITFSSLLINKDFPYLLLGKILIIGIIESFQGLLYLFYSSCDQIHEHRIVAVVEETGRVAGAIADHYGYHVESWHDD